MAGDNAAPQTIATASATASSTANASSSILRPSFVPLRNFAAATAKALSSTTQIGADPCLQGETELQPWSYRRASYSELAAVRRAGREQTDLNARRATEIWKEFWT
jgi:hypothetical protein